MSPDSELVEKLTTLNQISETLNHAVDVKSVLSQALAKLVQLVGLETAWIALTSPHHPSTSMDTSFVLAAHHNLPPALDPESTDVWQGSCACQDLFREGRLNKAANQVSCSRLKRVPGDSRGLGVHASVPLSSGGEALGILNVAAADWSSFSPEVLGLLTNVGSQLGIALERARLYDLLQERHTQQEATLLHFSNQLLARLDLDDLIKYLVGAVQQILRADASALLLPDEASGSLFFRASSGWLEDPVAARRQLLIDEPHGPAWVMRTREPLLREDLRIPDLAAWMPAWLQSEGFQAYALVPLQVQDRAIGVLMLGQRQPRQAVKSDLDSLNLLANQAAIAIEKARLHDEEVRMRALDKEMEIGHRIQLSLLPDAPPSIPGWEFATYYRAANEVGGDFFDHFAVPGDPEQLGLLIGDVTGKGIPAALLMARYSSQLRVSALQLRSPAVALMQANSLILGKGENELLVTALYALLDTSNGHLVYANAGHPRPLWRTSATGEVRELNSLGFLLGALQGAEIEQCELDMEPGDVLVLYTDGVTEAMNADHMLLGTHRLRAAIAASNAASAQQVLEAILSTVESFSQGMPQSDDLAMIVVRRC